MFWRIRVLAFYLTVTIFTVTFVSSILIPLKLFDVKYHIKYKAATIFSYIFIWLAKIICGLDYKVVGLEKLPKTASIVLANHQSFWDNVFMQIIIPEHSWIIKRELFKIPFFGWGLKIVDPIAVDRKDNISVKQILREGQKKLTKGLWLVIFPESTRLRPEQTTKFKPSAVKLALMTKVPLVLIAHNAGVYWPKGFWIKRPGVIQVKIVSVIFPELTEEKQDVRSLTETIEKLINTEKQILFERAIKGYD